MNRDPDPIAYTAEECAVALRVDVSTFYKMCREGRIPQRVQLRSTWGQEKGRRYSRRLLELWALDVDVEALTDAELIDLHARLVARGKAS